MKRILLSGAALCALAATPAMAADDSGVKLSLGGYFKGYVSYVDQDEVAGSSVRTIDILRQTEIHFDGKTTLDNGLTVGTHIEGRADPGDDFAVDESYLFFSGDWGKVNLGATYGTPYILQVVAPAADANVDGRLQLIQPVDFTSAGIALGTTTETDYDHDVSAKVDKLSYISPVFSGFQAGVSFTPEGDRTASRALSGNEADNDDADPSSDIWEAAVRFENKMDDLTYRVGAGYTQAQVETGSADDRQAWNVGLDLDIGAWGVGAAYQVDDLGDANDDVKYTVVGIDYDLGSVVLGASYYNKNDDVNTVELDRYSVGANYKVATGIGLRGSVGYYDVEDVNSDAQATAILIGTDIKF
ncbi:MAG: porin [Pseudobdellovibrionaceae bacterium]